MYFHSCPQKLIYEIWWNIYQSIYKSVVYSMGLEMPRLFWLPENAWTNKIHNLNEMEVE